MLEVERGFVCGTSGVFVEFPFSFELFALAFGLSEVVRVPGGSFVVLVGVVSRVSGVVGVVSDPVIEDLGVDIGVTCVAGWVFL